MKLCRTCQQTKPESEYNKYSSGTLKCDCKECIAEYQRMRRARGRAERTPDYTPNFTQCRHPDERVMRLMVKRLVKHFGKIRVTLKEAGLDMDKSFVRKQDQMRYNAKIDKVLRKG
jgi:hypothetical protein